MVFSSPATLADSEARRNFARSVMSNCSSATVTGQRHGPTGCGPCGIHSVPTSTGPSTCRNAPKMSKAPPPQRREISGYNERVSFVTRNLRRKEDDQEDKYRPCDILGCRRWGY